MIEQLTNNVAEWGGLNVDGFANLLLVLFALVVVLEVGIALYDRTKKTKEEAKERWTQETGERVTSPTCQMGTY